MMRLAISLITCLLCLSAFADDGYTKIVLHMVNGSTYELRLDNSMAIDTADGMLCFSSRHTSYSISQDDIELMTFGTGEVSGIGSTNSDERPLLIIGNRSITVVTPKPCIIRLFTTGGSLVASMQVDAGTHDISTDGIAPGAYIAQMDNLTTKFVVK